ncbi:MAG: hypothetical protein LBU60_01110 [Clostridiales bacterium]|jgi:transposase-like protein|nr:hypothetical protein [Clostridiales bacterium]
MTWCKKCGSTQNQVKSGKTSAGSQRMYCKQCRTVYTPIKKCYDKDIKILACQLYLSGKSFRQVGKKFNVDGNTVSMWVQKFSSNF